jgi:tetratricopeptide (TPR) repeat protein
MKRSKITQLLSFCLTVGLSAATGLAQNETKPQPSDKSAQQDTQLRSRSAPVGPTGEKPAAAASSTQSEPQAKPSGATSKAGSSEKPTEPGTAKAVQPEATTHKEADTAPVDPVVGLRDQIRSAATITEKVRLQFELVDLLLANGAKKEAVNELRVMANEERFDPSGFYNIGNAQARLNDSEGAINTYRKAIEQRKGRYSRALNNLGVMMLRLGRWDEAYDAFNSALRIENFRYAEASYNLGRLYAARGEEDLAAREWKRAVTVNPEHRAAAQALSSAGTAGRISVSAVPRNAASDTSANITRMPPESVTRAAKPARSAPASRTLTVDRESYDYLQRARSARERGRFEEAISNYRQVINRMGGYFAPANLEMSYALITLKRSDEAIANLVAVTRHDGSRYPISHYHLARLYESKGDYKLAEESYARAANSYGHDNAQFLLDVSRVRERLGDLQGALSALEEYVAIMERKNLRPQWSDDRMTSLKQKLAASQPKP